MRNDDNGEFELVVGNRQLLSGFFIVVLLFAVAFAMGYVVGQNVPRSSKAASDSTGSTAGAASDARPLPASPVPRPPAQTAEPASQAADESPHPSTQAAREPGTAGAAALPSSSAPALVASAALPAGAFWQLMAVRQPEAEAMRQTLRDKGFPAVLSPGPNHLTRVLVGPYGD